MNDYDTIKRAFGELCSVPSCEQLSPNCLAASSPTADIPLGIPAIVVDVSLVQCRQLPPNFVATNEEVR